VNTAIDAAATSRQLVWLPFDPVELGDPPSGLRYEIVRSLESAPASVGEVEFFVLPYPSGPKLASLLPKLGSLKVVQALSAGVESIRTLIPESVVLCNGRSIHAPATAEFAVTLMLASLRGIPRFLEQQRRCEWDDGGELLPTAQRIAIVGYGTIGSAIEARLAPFGFEIVRVARRAREGVYGFADLATLLPTLDVVILAVPLTSETRGLVDASFLASLKDDALVVNIARGPVVVTHDIVAALQSGRVRYAADVTDPEPLPPGHPLWAAPNVVITPHVASSTSLLWPRAYTLVREQLRRFADGEPLANVITGEY
jgi:phosphoglycerate dehydrogenase-like enzyme